MKSGWSGPQPLPPPPPKPTEGEPRRTSAEDKYRALRASRRGQGLCIHCGAKWNRDHKCLETVQLHVMQEILDMFPDQDEASDSGPSSPTHSQIMMHLLAAVSVGSVSPKTLCLTGAIHGQPLSILIDSGSSDTFLSSALAGSLSGI